MGAGAGIVTEAGGVNADNLRNCAEMNATTRCRSGPESIRLWSWDRLHCDQQPLRKW
jgi:hypothetical protein